jgi:hypothetical protein
VGRRFVLGSWLSVFGVEGNDGGGVGAAERGGYSEDSLFWVFEAPGWTWPAVFPVDMGEGVGKDTETVLLVDKAGEPPGEGAR